MNINRITKLIYPSRVSGHLLVSISACFYIYYTDLSSWFYALAVFTGIIWPNACSLAAQFVKDPKRFELNCMGYFDSYIVAIWIPICSFSPWFIVFVVAGMGMACISVGGFSMLIKSLSSMILSMFTVGLLMHYFYPFYKVSIETNLPSIFSMLLSTIVFSYVVASHVYSRALRIKKTRFALEKANNELNNINKIILRKRFKIL
jgi:diguanylate cyclase